mmetsp:Transcript_6238/g.19684  ORF Transcript_6238/g.19684 Transcript_6238/m.19684 type:complete len:86 (-) Transcript_6238:31-288(-)
MANDTDCSWSDKPSKSEGVGSTVRRLFESGSIFTKFCSLNNIPCFYKGRSIHGPVGRRRRRKRRGVRVYCVTRRCRYEPKWQATA